MKRALLGVGMLMAGLVMIRAQEKPTPGAQTLQKMAARFAPTDITADLSKFSVSDRRLLARLVEADVYLQTSRWEGMPFPSSRCWRPDCPPW